MPFILLAVIALVLSPVATFAQTGEVSVEAQCFDTLKQNIIEAKVFSDAQSELVTLSYNEVSNNFSAKYKTLVPFGIGVDEPIFTNRVYSFGEQTGYTHPPVSAFPSSIKSVAWENPVKEYVIGEEYVTDPAGVEHFVSCFFLFIDSAEPLLVTEDRYSYDGQGVSLQKTSADGSYKALYTQNVGFDYRNIPFVNWKKMFVYPKQTTNPYFSKYGVADAYLANNVESFSILEFFFQDILEVQDFDVEKGVSVIKYFLRAEGSEPAEIVPNPALVPVTRTGADTLFSRASYYEAIEAVYPEFAKKLSVEGSVKYKTFIDIISSPEIDLEIQQFLELFGNTELFYEYHVKKMAGDTSAYDAELERQMLLVQNGDWTLAQLKSGATLDSLNFVPPVETVAPSETVVPTSPVSQQQPDQTKIILILIVIVSSIISGLLVYIQRTRNAAVQPKI